MLLMENGICSPVQRDLDILLRLHRFLILASCDWRHDELPIQSVDRLPVKYKKLKRRHCWLDVAVIC